MPKILSITLNPSIDKSIVVPVLAADQKLHCGSAMFEPGGGGVNVARAIKNLEGTAQCWFLAGGYYGSFFIKLIRSHDLDYRSFPIVNETRECVIIYDQSTNKQYLMDLDGPFVSGPEWRKMLDAFSALQDVDFLVLSGSLPPGVPDDFFAKITRIAKSRNIKVFLDCSGTQLELALKEGVYLFKPNLKEFCILTAAQPESFDDLKLKGHALIHAGACQVIVLSFGAKGALLITKNRFEHIHPPDVEKISTVGAGDSMVGGIVYQLSIGSGILKAVQYGVACGTAATMNLGTSLCKKRDADALFERILQKSDQ